MTPTTRPRPRPRRTSDLLIIRLQPADPGCLCDAAEACKRVQATAQRGLLAWLAGRAITG